MTTTTSHTFEPVRIGNGTAVHLSSGRALCDAFARTRALPAGTAATCPKCLKIAAARSSR